MAFATIGTRGIQAQSVDLSSKVTGTLPVPNGGLGIASGTTGQFLKFTGTETLASAAVTEGLAEADNWRQSTTSGYTGSGRNVLTSNWERNDTNWEQVGTGMSQSSGIFTFPSTGKYLIQYLYMWTTQDSGGTNRVHDYVYSEIEATTDNSSYDRIARGVESNSSTAQEFAKSNYCSVMLDVTNTTNQKVKFGSYIPAGIFVLGHSSRTDTGVSFLKLGDT